MTTFEYITVGLLAVDLIASALILVVAMEVRDTLNGFVGKYHKRRATVTSIK